MVEKYNVDLAAFKKSLKRSEKDALDTVGFELPRVKSSTSPRHETSRLVRSLV